MKRIWQRIQFALLIICFAIVLGLLVYGKWWLTWGRIH